MRCQRCSEEFVEDKIQVHHIHPRFMDNKKGDGMKCNICEKCHNILHFKIPGILWRFIPLNKRKKAIQSVIEFTERGFK